MRSRIPATGLAIGWLSLFAVGCHSMNPLASRRSEEATVAASITDQTPNLAESSESAPPVAPAAPGNVDAQANLIATDVPQTAPGTPDLDVAFDAPEAATRKIEADANQASLQSSVEQTSAESLEAKPQSADPSTLTVDDVQGAVQPAANVTTGDAPSASTDAMASMPSVGERFSSAAKNALDLLRLPGPGSLSGQPDLATAIHQFDRFPFQFTLPNVAGETVESEQFGGQLMVVDIWATWCGPCRKAIPDFIELQTEFESQGVQVVGITCDSDDPADAAETARKAFNIGREMNVNYPLLVDDGTTRPQIPGFRSYPTTLFVTSDGMVRYMAVGVQPKDRMREIIRTVLQI